MRASRIYLLEIYLFSNFSGLFEEEHEKEIASLNGKLEL